MREDSIDTYLIKEECTDHFLVVGELLGIGPRTAVAIIGLGLILLLSVVQSLSLVLLVINLLILVVIVGIKRLLHLLLG